MKLYILIILILIFFIFHLLQKIRILKIKIISLSRQNTSILQSYNSRKITKNFFDNISNTDIKFIKISSQIAFLRNASYIRIAPFDFAPKIIDIQKNTEIKIISKILISNEYWYEIIVNNTDLSYNLKGWIKEHGIEFIYPTKTTIINPKNIF